MKNILVVMALTDSCAGVLDKGVELARAFSGKVWLVHVTPEESPKWGPDYVGDEEDSDRPRRQAAEELREKHRKLQQVAQALRNDGVETVALMVEGVTQEKILSEADRVDADLIVMGSRCHDTLMDRLVGNACDWVMQQTRRPLLVVPVSQE